MSIHHRNHKKPSLSERALLSLLRSKRVTPAASPSSATEFKGAAHAWQYPESERVAIQGNDMDKVFIEPQC